MAIDAATGLEPDDGPVLATDDITAANSESPPDFVDALRWRSAALAVDEVAMVEPPVQELGIDL